MEEQIALPELPNFVTLLEKATHGTTFSEYAHLWENVIFSIIIILVISTLAFFGSRKKGLIPGRLQSLFEIIFGGFDEFVTGVLGPKGRKFTPFIGTLFIYILSMNLFGLIPFMKSSTSSLSTTASLAICVFVYVQYTAFKELGFFGYMDHLMDKPRGFLAYSGIFPLLMLFLHIVSELVKPVTLSLRLRSNVWGDDILLAVLAKFGITGVPILLFSTMLVIIAGIVQAMVFSLLSTIYFALVLTHDDH